MRRVFIVHCWGGNPKYAWYPWVKEELEKENIKVKVLKMPHTQKPKMKEWVKKLGEVVGIPDENTILIGHSIGCQTILRYLESLQKKVKVRGIILVAGFYTLNKERLANNEEHAIINPWLTTPIDHAKVREHTKEIIAILSDTDPWVPLENKGLLKKKLGAEVIVERGCGHFSEEDNCKELPIVVQKVLAMRETSKR